MQDDANFVPSIALQTYDEAAILRLEAITSYDNGNYYKCELVLRSGKFSAEVPFYFDATSLAEALHHLKSMQQLLPGTATIGQQYEEDHIQIAVNQYGQVVVSGTIIEYGEYKQRLEFTFRTDQTIFAPLIHDLTRLLNCA